MNFKNADITASGSGGHPLTWTAAFKYFETGPQTEYESLKGPPVSAQSPAVITNLGEGIFSYVFKSGK